MKIHFNEYQRADTARRHLVTDGVVQRQFAVLVGLQACAWMLLDQ
jgi:hypothetical protein